MTTLPTLEALHAALTTAASLARQCEEQGADIGYARGHIDDAMADMAPALQDEREAVDAEPCSQAAIDRGCTCRMEMVHAGMINPPEPIVNKFCPLHGIADPDALAEMRREMREAAE